MKRFEFVSQAAKKAYLALPKEIQYQFGVDLNAVQQGSTFSSQSSDRKRRTRCHRAD